jgi:putative addiction module killer protein
MVEVRKTQAFAKWFERLRDRRAARRIQVRIDRLEMGNPGQVRNLAAGVSEMKIDYGPGYRVYFARKGEAIVILLCGGDKHSQQKDIAKAIELAKQV